MFWNLKKKIALFFPEASEKLLALVEYFSSRSKPKYFLIQK